MPAQSFKALGAGNGFPFCLDKFSGTAESPYIEVGNPLTLKETMNSYWNFDKGSWGGAEFDPTNEPKDLAGSSNANIGFDMEIIHSDSNGIEYFQVSNQRPRIFVAPNGEEHYHHGISFEYHKEVQSADSTLSDSIDVIYTSPIYNDTGQAYICDTVITTRGTNVGPPGYTTYTSTYPIGKSATEKTVSADSVEIGGLPFVKLVITEFQGVEYDGSPGESAPCPVSEVNLTAPSVGEPSLTFHTY